MSQSDPPFPLNWLFTFLSILGLTPPWTYKKAFFIVLVLLCFSIFSIVYFVYSGRERSRDDKMAIGQLRSENEQLREEKTSLTQKLSVLGYFTERNVSLVKDVSNFIKDWDTSSFHLIGTDTFCPKDKGNNNYQRMTYKYDTPFTASNLNLKFQMVDQDDKKVDYNQRVVVGTKLDNSVFSEFDFPTKSGQVVNFRVASESGELVSGGEGKSIGSPIIDKTIINLNFQTKLKHGQDVTQILTLNYISKYGPENKDIVYDSKVNDSRPETTRTNLFVGSYLGGCIKIIDWQAN